MMTMMNSWKTTIALLTVLAFSFAWTLRPRQSALPDASQMVPDVSQEAPKKLEVSASARPENHRPRPRQHREREAFRLQTTKSLEEQRLHDLKLLRLFCEHGVANHGTVIHVSTLTPSGDETELAQLARKREEKLEEAHENYLKLEEYLSTTELTTLSEEEKEAVYQFADLRRRIDEAQASYFETTPETWMELGFKISLFRGRCAQLLKRQFEHDSKEVMTLDEALNNCLTVSCMRGMEFHSDCVIKIEIRHFPGSSGVAWRFFQ